MRINSGWPIPIPDISEELNQSDVAGEINKPIEDPQYQDTIHNDSRATSMQSELRLSGNMQQFQLLSQLNTLGVGSSGPQVKQLQNQLNEWLVAQGKPPIGADGIFGKQTETAVKDFQLSMGIKQDGLAGPDVKRHLDSAMKLSQDPDYQMLSPNAQNLATISLARNPNDPGRLANVKGMVKDMATLEQDPSYQQLPANTQQGVRNLMYQFTEQPIGRQFLSELAKDGKFQNLSPEQQEKTLGILMSNSNAELGDRNPYYMNQILNTKALDGPKDDVLTNAVLNTTGRVASDAGKLYLLKEMLNDPSFVNAPREDQLAMLNGFSGNSGVQIDG